MLLPWSLRHVTTCRTHGVLLLDRCPGCHTPVDLDVRANTCARCGLAIGAFPTTSIAAHPDSIALTELIWSAIGCRSGPFPPPAVGLEADHPLRRVGTSDLLRGLWDCAQQLVLYGADTPLFQPEALLPGVYWDAPAIVLESLDIVGVHTALAAAWRLLREWPTAWHTVLRPGPGVDMTRSGGGVPFPVVLRYDQDAPVWTLADRAWLNLVWDRSAEGYPWARFDLAACPATPCYPWAYHWGTADLALGFEDAARYCQLNQADFATFSATRTAVCGGGKLGEVRAAFLLAANPESATMPRNPASPHNPSTSFLP